MSRYTLKPGDLLMVDPVIANVTPTPAVVAENGVDLMFAWNPKPWHQQRIANQPGLTAQEAEQVLQGKREYEWAVLYKVWDEESQTPYAPPESVIEEIERRQMAVEPIKSDEGIEAQGKIPPKPLDFDSYPQTGMW